MFKIFFPTLQRVLTDITAYWKLILSHIDSYWDNSSIEIALAGVRAVETMLIASKDVESYPEELWRQVLICCPCGLTDVRAGIAI